MSFTRRRLLTPPPCQSLSVGKPCEIRASQENRDVERKAKSQSVWQASLLTVMPTLLGLFIFIRAQSCPVLFLSLSSFYNFNSGSSYDFAVKPSLTSFHSDDFWQFGYMSPPKRSICQTPPLAQPSRLCLAEASNHIPHVSRRAPG